MKMKEPASPELWLVTALVAIVAIIVAVSWLGVYAGFELFHRFRHGNWAALSASEVLAKQKDEPRQLATGLTVSEPPWETTGNRIGRDLS